MGLITIETEAYQNLMKRLDVIDKKLDEKNEQYPLKEKWLDNQDVCMLLHISKRTLQHYRDKDILPYSQFASKIYYKASDVEEFLNKNYNNSQTKKSDK